MTTTIQEWRERTKPQRRAQLAARHRALADLREMKVEFDFLRPCESTFDPSTGGWRKVQTSYHLMTRSVEVMYVKTLGEGKSVRAIQLSTGHLYYLRTFNL